MSSRLSRALQGLVRPETAALENQVERSTLHEVRWTNPSALTTTVAQAELAIGSVKAPSRLAEAKYVPSSGGITGNATHYLTLLVAARLSITPFTSRNLITYAADTPTTDDATQWDELDLSAYFNATLTNLDLAQDEILTVAVTKTGSDGLAFPAGTVTLRLRPRDV